MRKKIPIALFSVWLSFACEAQFGSPKPIDTTQDVATSQLCIADFNNDGKNDLLTTNDKFPYDAVKLYTNLGGNTFSGQALPEADSLTNIAAIDIGDIDKNGWMDFAIITGNGTNTKLSWYKNTGGGFTPAIIDSVNDFTTGILLRDLNNDGLVDIVALEHTEIVVRFATGAGVFGARQIVHSGTEFYAIDVNHFNNDAFAGISVAHATGFEILKNNGGASFSLVSSNADQEICLGLKSGDTDGDGDNDIVAYDNLKGLRLYLNDGSGHFSLQGTVLASIDNFRIFGLKDLNCDNKVDIYTAIQQQGKMVWLANNGANSFSTPNLVGEQAGSLVAASTSGDLNGDGKPDLAWGRADVFMAANQCLTTGVNSPDPAMAEITIFPIPASGSISIKNNSGKKVYAEIFNVLGQKIMPAKEISRGVTEMTTLKTGGVYFITFTLDGKPAGTRKIINY